MATPFPDLPPADAALRAIGRVAIGLALLALLLGGLALHAVRTDRATDAVRGGATLMGATPVVTSLKGGGAADRAGLHVGDVVERVDGHVPQSLAEVEHAMASGRPADLHVRRGAREIDVTVR